MTAAREKIPDMTVAFATGTPPLANATVLS